jgi:hypothetical protein
VSGKRHRARAGQGAHEQLPVDHAQFDLHELPNHMGHAQRLHCAQHVRAEKKASNKKVRKCEKADEKASHDKAGCTRNNRKK